MVCGVDKRLWRFIFISQFINAISTGGKTTRLTREKYVCFICNFKVVALLSLLLRCVSFSSIAICQFEMKIVFFPSKPKEIIFTFFFPRRFVIRCDWCSSKCLWIKSMINLFNKDNQIEVLKIHNFKWSNWNFSFWNFRFSFWLIIWPITRLLGDCNNAKANDCISHDLRIFHNGAIIAVIATRRSTNFRMNCLHFAN